MKDILLNDMADLQTVDGDFVIDLSDLQHQEHLIVFQKGALKGKPDVGVGMENYLNSDDVDGMLRELRFQFETDGMTVNAVSFDDDLNNLDYEANYKG